IETAQRFPAAHPNRPRSCQDGMASQVTDVVGHHRTNPERCELLETHRSQGARTIAGSLRVVRMFLAFFLPSVAGRAMLSGTRVVTISQDGLHRDKPRSIQRLIAVRILLLSQVKPFLMAPPRVSAFKPDQLWQKAREPMFWLDQALRVTWVNRAWEGLTGHRAESLLGQTCAAYGPTEAGEP